MIKVEGNDFPKYEYILGDCPNADSLKRRQFSAKSNSLNMLSGFFDGPSEYDSKERFFHFDHTPIDEVDVENGCYDIVIVENWQPEQVSAQENSRTEWNGEGELLAEISVETPSSDLIERPQQSESEDCANLSWLLNFRLDELISSTCEDQPPGVAGGGGKEAKVEEPTPEDQVVKNLVDTTQKKPPYTYTELIELALRDKGELTVSGIYHWISERFPFFKPQDDRWKNSVRHNLSINPHFRKGVKATRGAGHLWTIAAPSAALDRVLASTFLARRLQRTHTLEQEVAAAAASILQQHHTEFLNPVSVEQVAVECGLLDGELTFNY